jgi:hypothetical protein
MGTPCAFSARICFFGDMAAAATSACWLHRRTYDDALGPSSVWRSGSSSAASCCSGYCPGKPRSSACTAGLPIPPAISSTHAAATPHSAATAAPDEFRPMTVMWLFDCMGPTFLVREGGDDRRCPKDGAVVCRRRPGAWEQWHFSVTNAG